ncbi:MULTISPECIES: hypothetical protein [unclassified Brevundimonas]|nr:MULTISPECIES: hypothetical protein [unclassified Brevundimonas]MCK6105565.1 hypothetical protein [Brevundimonas sp. EYE_349]
MTDLAQHRQHVVSHETLVNDSKQPTLSGMTNARSSSEPPRGERLRQKE